MSEADVWNSLVVHNLHLWASNKKPVMVLEVTNRISSIIYEIRTLLSLHDIFFYQSPRDQYLLVSSIIATCSMTSLFSYSSLGIRGEVLESIALHTACNK